MLVPPAEGGGCRLSRKASPTCRRGGWRADPAIAFEHQGCRGIGIAHTFFGNLRGIRSARRDVIDEGVELAVNPRMHPEPGKPQLGIAAQAHGEALLTVFRCNTRMNRLARRLDIGELPIRRRSARRGCTGACCKGKKHGLPSGPHAQCSCRYDCCCATLISSGAPQQVCAGQAGPESKKASSRGLR